MSLTTKPRLGQAHKKLRANHHRHSKNYLKTYWPYIPVAAIIGIGVLIAHGSHYSSTPTLSSYTYYDILESSIGVIALSIFLLRHAFAWRKVVTEGEAFVTKHPLLDIGLVTLAVGGLLLAHQFPA